MPPANRHQTLDDSVHTQPFYEDHGLAFPCPVRDIDSVLRLQLENGRWLEATDVHVMNYLELEALYALEYMSSLIPSYRRHHIHSAVNRYARLVLEYSRDKRAALFTLCPHLVLAATGTFGLLERLRPDLISGKAQWTDIFVDRRLYQSAAVEYKDC